MTKLIFDISEEMNDKLQQLVDKRGVKKAPLARWAISKMLEAELNGPDPGMD